MHHLTVPLLCCIPYAFLCLYGDAEHDTMLAYTYCTIFCLALMRRTHRISPALFAGHGLSFLSSCLCLQLFRTERWQWYFKPFSAFQVLAALSLAALIIHLFLCRRRRD